MIGHAVHGAFRLGLALLELMFPADRLVAQLTVMAEQQSPASLDLGSTTAVIAAQCRAVVATASESGFGAARKTMIAATGRCLAVVQELVHWQILMVAARWLA